MAGVDLKAAKPSDIVAVVSLVISVISSTFAIYQWIDSDNDAKIRSAIEISRNYLKDRDPKEEEILERAYLNQDLSQSQIVAMSRLLDQLDYIALLANKNKIDMAYLSFDINCEIYMAKISSAHMAKKLPGMRAFHRPETTKFAADPGCQKMLGKIPAS